MTPQERQLVEDLFDRLATLERNPREPDAEDAIRDGLRRAPHAVYALVQTVLLQEQALRQANDRIEELEAAEAPPQQQGGGFLDSMRDAVFGGGNPRASVPPVGAGRPMGVPSGFPRSGDPAQAGGPQYPQQAEPAARGGGAGGSFLGTAAAAAAGVIGGSMLMNALKGAFGGDQAQAQGLGNTGSQQGTEAAAANPWGDAASGGGDLAQQAGLDNIGQSQHAGLFGDQHQPADDGYLPGDDGGFDDMDFDSDFA